MSAERVSSQTTQGMRLPGLAGLCAAHGRLAADSLNAMRRHFAAETTNDVEQIMPTMKRQGELYTAAVMETPTDDRMRIVICRNVEEQREFYRRARTEDIHLLDIDLFTTLASDWYGLVHGMAKMRLLATGEVVTDEILGLCPISEDHMTMAGEIGFARPRFAKDPQSELERTKLRLQNLSAHETLMDAIRSSDSAAIAKCYAEEPSVVLRDYASPDRVERTTRRAVDEHWRSFFDRFSLLAVELIGRHCETWYTMSELRWEVADGEGSRTSFRTADLLGLDPRDKIGVHVGWGTDMIPVEAHRRLLL